MAKQPQQAFDVAQTHAQMDAYVRFMGSHASSEDCVKAAMYYEAHGNLDAAALLYSQSGQPNKALLLYMQVGASAFKGLAPTTALNKSHFMLYCLFDVHDSGCILALQQTCGPFQVVIIALVSVCVCCSSDLFSGGCSCAPLAAIQPCCG